MYRFRLVIDRITVYGQRLISRSVDMRCSFWLFRAFFIKIRCTFISRSSESDHQPI